MPPAGLGWLLEAVQTVEADFCSARSLLQAVSSSVCWSSVHLTCTKEPTVTPCMHAAGIPATPRVVHPHESRKLNKSMQTIIKRGRGAATKGVYEVSARQSNRTFMIWPRPLAVSLVHRS